MDSIIASLFGQLCGVYWVAVFLNFIIRKIRGNDSLFQKIFATIISVCINIFLTPSFLARTSETAVQIFSGAFISFICGLIVILFFLKGIRLKKVLLIGLYGCLFFIPVAVVYNVTAAFFFGGSNLKETPTLIFGLIASLILVNDRKLPWTKDL